jgi:hypothetical protein
MTKIPTQKPYKYFIDLNIDNVTYKVYSFYTKQAALTFFTLCLKTSALLNKKDTAFISAIFYLKNNKKKHVLFKKNLTKVSQSL